MKYFIIIFSIAFPLHAQQVTFNDAKSPWVVSESGEINADLELTISKLRANEIQSIIREIFEYKEFSETDEYESKIKALIFQQKGAGALQNHSVLSTWSVGESYKRIFLMLRYRYKPLFVSIDIYETENKYYPISFSSSLSPDVIFSP